MYVSNAGRLWRLIADIVKRQPQLPLQLTYNLATNMGRRLCPAVTSAALLHLLLALCLYHRAAAQTPAPQPPDGAPCQFDVGFGLYDLSALNVGAAPHAMCRPAHPSSSLYRNWGSKSSKPTLAPSTCRLARKFERLIAPPCAASTPWAAAGPAAGSRRAWLGRCRGRSSLEWMGSRCCMPRDAAAGL